MRVAVTGAGGFLGLNLVRELASRGHEVLALDRVFGTRAAKTIAEAGRAKAAVADILDRQAVEAALTPFRPDALFHGATLTADLNREKAVFSDILEVNVLGTGRVLEAARHAGVGRMIVASSSAVYGEAVFRASPKETDETRPTTLYGITKLAAEQAALRFARIHDLDVRVARIAAAFGPYEHRSGARDVMSPLFQIAEKALAGEEVRLPSGGARDWIGATRVAEVVAELFDRPAPAHAIYNVAAVSTWEPALFCAALAREVSGLRHGFGGERANIDYRDDLARRRSALDTERIRAELGDAILGSPETDSAAYAAWVAQHPDWFS